MGSVAMARFSSRLRRNVLVTISLLCLCCGALALYGTTDPQRVSQAGTPAMALMLGLLLLPGATLAARRLERRLRTRMGA